MLQFLNRLKQNMAFFDNSVCWEDNDKMVISMDQVVEEKDPLNCVTWNVFLSLSWREFVAEFVTRNIKSLFMKPQEFLQLPA